MSESELPDPRKPGFAAAMERRRSADALVTEGSNSAGITAFVPWSGDINDIPEVVAAMMAAGMKDCQIKMCMSNSVLRLSDYHTRSSADPKLEEGFWLADGVVKTGTADEWRAAKGETGADA